MASSALPDWAGRIARVRAELEVRDLGALVVSDRHNILYLTGFAGSAGLLLVTRDELRLILDGRYELVARQAFEAGRLAAVTIGGVETRYDQGESPGSDSIFFQDADLGPVRQYQFVAGVEAYYRF